MRWPGQRRRAEQARLRRESAELSNPYHQRSQLTDGEETLFAPQKIFANIEQLMERVDNDIDVPVAFTDAATPEEIATLVEDFAMGPALCAHIVNTAHRLMAARYPNRLVRAPLPPEFDLRQLTHLTLTDRQHDATRAVFNRRAGADADVEPDQVRRDLDGATGYHQIQIVIALFVAFGLKVGAIQRRLATE